MLTDPRSAGPRPPFPKQKQPPPGETQALEPTPDHGEKSYRGSGRFKDCAVLVTGGDSGIGRAVAIAFAREGADVAIAYLNEHEDAKETQRVVEAAGRKAILIPGDLADPKHCERLVEETAKAFGRIDILVNNAGWTGTGPALDVTEQEYDQTMAASLKSVFFACQAAARAMIPQGGGRIVNIGSNFGVVAFQGRAVYAAAKAGVHHLCKALSLEWAKHGVVVNGVAPCITETDSRKNIIERPGYREWATGTMLPIGRWNQPEDVVGAVLFLSSELSSMVVGHVIMVDGGWTIH